MKKHKKLWPILAFKTPRVLYNHQCFLKTLVGISTLYRFACAYFMLSIVLYFSNLLLWGWGKSEKFAVDNFYIFLPKITFTGNWFLMQKKGIVRFWSTYATAALLIVEHLHFSVCVCIPKILLGVCKLICYEYARAIFCRDTHCDLAGHEA